MRQSIPTKVEEMVASTVLQHSIDLALAALAKISVHCEFSEDRLLREEIDDAINGYLTACGLQDQERLLEKVAEFREQRKPQDWPTCTGCGWRVQPGVAEVGADGVSVYHAICYRRATREGEPR